ncbi:MAG: choice-of-anchor D domain-containing protein [Bryobacteraceae bacterium]
MRALFAALLFGTSLVAQSPSFFIVDPTGAGVLGPLPSVYQFVDTPAGSSASLVVRATNSSTTSIELAIVFVADTPGSTVLSPNFTLTGAQVDKVLSPGSSNFEDFTVNFTPPSQGPLSGVLRLVYRVQQNGCILGSSDPATRCPDTVADASTFQGNGTAPQLVASYNGPSGSGLLQPNSSSTQLNFGNVSTSAASSFTITLANQSGGPLNTPAVSIHTQVFGISAFLLNTSSLPTTIAAGSSANFTVTFAPGQIGLASATLAIGTNSYPLAGTGIVVALIDALEISYVDKTGVRGLPQAATPIDFGQVTSGTNEAATLTFTVTNPITSFDPITVPTLTVSGAGFTLTGGPAIPVSIQPGRAISFQVTFSGSTTGAYKGVLAIGTRQFSLIGQSVSSPLPDLSFKLDLQPLTSQHQVHLSIQVDSPSPVIAIGELTMQFTSSVANIGDDPAVYFLATSGRNLQVTVAKGAQTANYNGQSALTFQTGTTAGTITFTVTFPDKAPLTKSFTITPEQIQITSSKAIRQSPNLVLTLSGYDNSYSAGELSFIFYDTNGQPISPSPVTVNAASDFHKYFFGPSDIGGAFSMQASFPVLNGDAAKVSSVGVTLTNSVGSTTLTQTFH